MFLHLIPCLNILHRRCASQGLTNIGLRVLICHEISCLRPSEHLTYFLHARTEQPTLNRFSPPTRGRTDGLTWVLTSTPLLAPPLHEWTNEICRIVRLAG